MSHIFSIAGKRFLITGGTRGIGRAVSLQFAQAGAFILANYVRDQAAAEEFKRQSLAQGLSVEIFRADLTSPKGLEKLEGALPRDGALFDGFVHCAATGVHRPIEELTSRHFEWTFSLNAMAFLEIFKLMLPRLNRPASIVAVSSMGAMFAVPDYAVIGSSKAALESLVRSMAVEYAAKDIRINAVRPGSVRTNVWKVIPDGENRLEQARMRTPLGRLVAAEEVAAAVQFLCSDASIGIIGHTLVIDGGRSILE